MVRTATKPAFQPQPEPKKVTTSEKVDKAKKSHQKKARPDSGVWPCKMAGCNKQFAREADLKRHQRTTKSHSAPGFARSNCPQCDATFTRTDALRRHQKSRHNGVVIEPPEHDRTKPGINDDGASDEGSGSRSRSATPPPKHKRPGGMSKETSKPIPRPPPNNHYYRPHTNHSAYLPPNSVIMDPQYSQSLGLPTSATRLNEASWQPPPWAAHGGPQHLSYQALPPGAHPYANGLVYLPPNMPPPPGLRKDSAATQDTSSSESQPVSTASNASVREREQDVEMRDDSAIDPSLQEPAAQAAPDTKPAAPSKSKEDTPKGPDAKDPDESVKVEKEHFQTAIEAVLESAKREGNGSAAEPAKPAEEGTDNDKAMEDEDAQADEDADAQADEDDKMELVVTEVAEDPAPAADITAAPTEAPASAAAIPASAPAKAPNGTPGPSAESTEDKDKDKDTNKADQRADNEAPQGNGYPPLKKSPRTARPPPMETMLTEDGEPMLNPAELLTQESLATPPP